LSPRLCPAVSVAYMIDDDETPCGPIPLLSATARAERDEFLRRMVKESDDPEIQKIAQHELDWSAPQDVVDK